jgi:hypothetical protein
MMTTKPRREHLADEIGSANVVLVAEGYRQGWLDAMSAARGALSGIRLPLHSNDALQAWLDEPGPRFRLSGAALDITDGPEPTTEENPCPTS